MTLNDITIRSRILLSDPNYDATTIQNAANDFVNELFNNTRTGLMEASTTLSASAGDTTVPLPSNSMIWTTIYLISPQVYDLRDYYLEYNEFMARYANFATVAASSPYEWTEFNNSMRFSAPLIADAQFQVDFVRQPKSMTALTSKCELPDRYLELVAKGTKARCLEIDENYDEANVERENLAPLVTSFIRNEARGGGKSGPIIMRSRRRGHWMK